MVSKMVKKLGDCVKCGDSCLIINEVTINGKKDIVTNCVKNCAWVLNATCCEECLERFNTGKRYKKGELVK